MTRLYAEDTKVPIAQSITEIQKTAKRYGAEQFIYALGDDRIVIGFSQEQRQVRFQVPLDDNAQNNRRLARALLLVMKAKFESVASGVEIFEDAFLANIVMPNGQLLGATVRQRVSDAYATGKMPPMLPDYSK